ncbi:hypothetical protein Ccrd_020462 [Cynara cardunculus var. scolymus]|uniref:Uncharacterized protein n=1 Tax=Cynara cardunculus var. scolymus TaxID=59895 RepID=A0A103Y2E8_CYNCS|nr:hypothetical protein Ccrd_020462 [Cynara cardunculus var. scolymus]
MDIKMWRSSTVKPDRARERFGSVTHEPSGSASSKLVWKVIWKKLRREGKKLLVRLPSKHVQAPYDEYSYAQNFEQESEWRNELDILSRSFSVRYTNRPSTVSFR